MRELLNGAFAAMDISIDEIQTEQFFKYKKLLLEWNEKMNLTAITNERDIILKHFADSVSVLKFADFKGRSVVDIGTGAGFPGIPLKIVCPDIRLVLLDSLKKRIGFLENAVNELGFENVECVHSRAEDGGQNHLYRESFDFCISRAVANLSVLAEYCLPFVKVGGIFISLKGPDSENEIAEAKKAVGILGGEVLSAEKTDIPFTDIVHTIIMIKKLRQTPAQYPRKAGKINKSPIK